MLLGNASAAQQPRTCGDEPEAFHYLTLKLEWSDRYCAAASKRQLPACQGGKPFGLSFEGLRPYCIKGVPQYCSGADALDEASIAGLFDVIPDRRLIRFLWGKHVACAGLKPNEYTALIRLLNAAVKIPPELAPPAPQTELTVGEIKEAFQRVAPRMQPENLAVHCSGRFLESVELCLEKGLGLKTCGPDVHDTCPPGKIKLRATR